ncbi:MAG: guanylate kinase [Lachnospiraceae bacterium]|nr:guanylate kinase [Lachnospiraceae bacterium]
MNKLFVLMGKSATGKDTIYKELLEMPELCLRTIVPYTTRPIRRGERNGVEYFFVSDEKYKEMKEKGIVVEARDYHTVHGVWTYFTVDDGQFSRNGQRDNFLMINTLEGYKQIRDYFGEDKVVPLYVYVEDGIRLSRALKRERRQSEPKYAEMCRRFLADDEDFSEKNLKEAGIESYYDNLSIRFCVENIVKTIKKFG